jgi:hypothetical protein
MGKHALFDTAEGPRCQGKSHSRKALQAFLQEEALAVDHTSDNRRSPKMPLLTITNLTPGPLPIQDPSGYTQFSVTVPGTGSTPPLPVTVAQLGYLEPVLNREQAVGRLTWSIAADPSVGEDNLPAEIRTVLTSPDTVRPSDRYVVTNLATPGPVSEVLPADLPTGQVVTVADGKGDAQTNNVTVAPVGGATINGSPSRVLNTPFAAVTFLKIGPNAWLVVG